MGRPITKGSTDQSTRVLFIDSGTGFPVAAIDTGTAGLALWYQRGIESNVTIALSGVASAAAHSDGGFLLVDAGVCRVDLPDLACADSGLNDVHIGGAATGMICIGNEHALWDIDPYNRTDAGIAVLDDIDSNVSEIVVDTRTTIPAALDNIDSNVSEIVTDTRTTIPDAIDNVDSNVSTILGQTGTTGVTLKDDAITAAKIDSGAIIAATFGAGAIDGASLAADAVTKIASGVGAYVIEGTLTIKRALYYQTAHHVGKSSGGGTNTLTYRNYGDTKNAIVYTVDGDGNRGAVVLTP